MGWLPRTAAVASGLALAGCAGIPPTFRCPAHGGPPWREMATEHYLLRTDLPGPEAAELVGRIERLRAAVAAGLPGGAPGPPGRVDVVAFRTLEEYQPFSPDNALGYYIRYEGGPPRIVVPGEIGPWQRAMLAHELTHDFLAGKYRRQPRWFAEGLAVYMESVETDASGSVVTVGAPPPERLERARSSPVPVAELLEWDGSRGRRPAVDYYASSWLLMHWLVEERPRAFEALVRELSAGSPPEAAWHAALPEFDPDRPGGLSELDADLARHARAKLGRQRRQGEARPVVAYFERPMLPSEVHAVRIELWQFGSGRSTKALRSEVEEAVAEDPAHPVALEYLAALDHADPLPYARRAVAGHPNDARAYTFLAESLPGPGQAEEREAALRKAAEIAPRNAAALHNLAEALLADGKPLLALPAARQAAELAPWSPPVLAGYAEVLAGLGHCTEAIPVQQRAIEAIPDRGTTAERRALTKSLARYSEQCRVSGAAAP